MFSWFRKKKINKIEKTSPKVDNREKRYRGSLDTIARIDELIKQGLSKEEALKQASYEAQLINMSVFNSDVRDIK